MMRPWLAPGLFFDPSVFRWSVFQSKWKDAMLSRDGRTMPLREVALREPMFVRPDEDSKLFDGGVYDAEPVIGAPDTPVVVASPVVIDAEWRFFVVNREIVGCSPYLDLAASGDRIGVVAANCFNASRFYGASIGRVLRAVNAYVVGSSPYMVRPSDCR